MVCPFLVASRFDGNYSTPLWAPPYVAPYYISLFSRTVNGVETLQWASNTTAPYRSTTIDGSSTNIAPALPQAASSYPQSTPPVSGAPVPLTALFAPEVHRYTAYYMPWSTNCSVTCGTGFRTRRVVCIDETTNAIYPNLNPCFDFPSAGIESVAQTCQMPPC